MVLHTVQQSELSFVHSKVFNQEELFNHKRKMDIAGIVDHTAEVSPSQNSFKAGLTSKASQPLWKFYLGTAEG